MQSIGPFRLGMTRSDVEKLIKPEELGEGEQDGQKSISAYFMDPGKRVSMATDGQGKVRSLTLHGDRSAWRLAHGISLGTRLSELARLNGRPLRLHGFDPSERSGRVLDWQGGALAQELGSVRLTFASPARASGYNSLSGAQKEEIEKARDFLSSDAAMVALDPWLETIEINR